MSKILFFIPRMGGGGAERVVANLANEFDRRGNTVVIYTPTDDKSFYYLNDSVRMIGENYLISKKKGLRQLLMAVNGVRLWFSYGRRVRTEKPDAVISFLTETNCIASLHWHKKYRLIVSERNDPTKYSKITQIIIKKLYGMADALVCQSDCVLRYFASSNAVVIPNPIDITKLPSCGRILKRKVICAVGRLMPQKNFANLIRAFSYLDKRFNDYVLEIYGEGILRNELGKLIKELNLGEKVKLMGAHKDVLEKIKDTTLFVMSSDFEGYPNALVEAMAIGLPVISTDFSPGTAHEIIKKENGLIVPANNSEALAKAINYLLGYPEMLEKMGSENVKIRDKLRVERIANEWSDLI